MSDRSSLLHLDDRAVAAAVKAAVARTHGDYGAALCSIRFCGKGKMIHSSILPGLSSGHNYQQQLYLILFL